MQCMQRVVTVEIQTSHLWIDVKRQWDHMQDECACRGCSQTGLDLGQQSVAMVLITGADHLALRTCGSLGQTSLP